MMTIEEVKRLRLKLAADVTELVTTFQQATNCTVKSFDLTHFFCDAAAEPITTQVDVKIELPS